MVIEVEQHAICLSADSVYCNLESSLECNSELDKVSISVNIPSALLVKARSP